MQTENTDGVKPQIDRRQDGVLHINCWSKARTELGQMLSNFAHFSFVHPTCGMFASVEALWYWLKTGRTHDELRRLYGVSAKSAGSKLPAVPMDEEEFHQIIRDGIRAKIEQNQRLRRQFVESTLPFLHYYVYGKNNDVIVNKDNHRWQMDFLEQLRDELREHAGLPSAAESRALHHKPVHKPETITTDKGWAEAVDGHTTFEPR